MPTAKTRKSFEEVELGFDENTAVAEAKRCLACDLRFLLEPRILPPETPIEKYIPLSQEEIAKVPEVEGVIQLLNEKKEIIYIGGSMNLRKELENQYSKSKKVKYFCYEKEPLYTKRESELLQQFMKKHGRLPECNLEFEEELF